MLVQNYTTGRLVDDTRNGKGEERIDRELAHAVALEINDAMNLAAIAVAARQELSGFVVWLGEQSREHAIDNSLCANYERFLSFTLGEYRDQCIATDSIIRDDVEAFVVNASRPRRHVAQVNVPVNVSTISAHNDGVSAYDTAYNVRNGSEGEVQYDSARIVSGSSETFPLSYNEAQRANETFHRRGHYDYDRDDSYGY